MEVVGMLFVIGQSFDKYYVFDSEDGSLEVHPWRELVDFVGAGGKLANAVINKRSRAINFNISRVALSDFPVILEVGKDCLTYFGLRERYGEVFYIWLDGKMYLRPMYKKTSGKKIPLGWNDFVFLEDGKYYAFDVGVCRPYKLVLGDGEPMSRDGFKKNVILR